MNQTFRLTTKNQCLYRLASPSWLSNTFVYKNHVNKLTPLTNWITLVLNSTNHGFKCQLLLDPICRTRFPSISIAFLYLLLKSGRSWRRNAENRVPIRIYKFWHVNAEAIDHSYLLVNKKKDLYCYYSISSVLTGRSYHDHRFVSLVLTT